MYNVIILQTIFSGEPYKLTWIINHKKQCLVASLSLPFYRPGAPLDDVNHSFHKVFEKMMEDKLKSLSVSIDSLGSWPIGCFVPRLLRAFIHYVTMAPALNLSLVVISSTEDNFEKVKGICKEIIYGEDKKQSKLPIKEEQWLSGRVLDSGPRGHRFEPHRRHCVVVLEQDTLILP